MALRLVTAAVLLALLSLAGAHFPPHCRCVCHVGTMGLSRARGDCFAPGAMDCRVRLCRRFNSAGFSCCMPDPGAFGVPEIPTQVPPAPADGSASSAGDPDATVMPAAAGDDHDAPQGGAMSPLPIPSPPPMTANTGIISFAADDQAELIINGDSVAVLKDSTMVGTVARELKKGDVIGIRAKDRGGFYGVIASLEMGGSRRVTGDGTWKARAAFKIPGEYLKWASKAWNSCKWPAAEVLPDAGIMISGKARTFPYSTGARYVWAKGSHEFQGIYMRHVVGGEEC